MKLGFFTFREKHLVRTDMAASFADCIPDTDQVFFSVSICSQCIPTLLTSNFGGMLFFQKGVENCGKTSKFSCDLFPRILNNRNVYNITYGAIWAIG